MMTVGRWHALPILRHEPKPKSRSGARSFFSNRYIKSYYTKVAQQSPTLATLDSKVIATISDYWIGRVKAVRIYESTAVPYYVVWYLIVLKTFNPYVIYIGIIPIIAATLTFYCYISRFNNEGLAASRLFRTIAILEQNPSCWQTSSKFRFGIARRLEGVAKSIEHIPLELNSVAPSVKRQFAGISRTKALGIRELQIWAIEPGPFTFTDLVNRLFEDMNTIANGKWYELRSAEHLQQYSSRWIRVTAISGSIILAASGIAVLVYSAKVGPAAAVLAPVLFAATLVPLTAAGIPSGVMARYSGMASQLSSQSSSLWTTAPGIASIKPVWRHRAPQRSARNRREPPRSQAQIRQPAGYISHGQHALCTRPGMQTKSRARQDLVLKMTAASGSNRIALRCPRSSDISALTCLDNLY